MKHPEDTETHGRVGSPGRAGHPQLQARLPQAAGAGARETAQRGSEGAARTSGRHHGPALGVSGKSSTSLRPGVPRGGPASFGGVGFLGSGGRTLGTCQHRGGRGTRRRDGGGQDE